MTKEVLGLSPEVWGVIGTIASGGALLIGSIAAMIAALEYRLGRTVRQEQTRPYMTIAAEPGLASNHLIEIAIKNVGTTPAHQLRIDIDPPFLEVRPDEHSLSRARVFNEVIEMWPPGYELRAFFDSHIERNGKGLPTAHIATLIYRDERGSTWTERVVIDLDLHAGMTYIETFGTHHAAKALRDIEKAISRSNVLKKGELDVTTETRSERTGRQHELRAARAARMEGLQALAEPSESAGDDSGPETVVE